MFLAGDFNAGVTLLTLRCLRSFSFNENCEWLHLFAPREDNEIDLVLCYDTHYKKIYFSIYYFLENKLIVECNIQNEKASCQFGDHARYESPTEQK